MWDWISSTTPLDWLTAAVAVVFFLVQLGEWKAKIEAKRNGYNTNGNGAYVTKAALDMALMRAAEEQRHFARDLVNAEIGKLVSRDTYADRKLETDRRLERLEQMLMSGRG